MSRDIVPLTLKKLDCEVILYALIDLRDKLAYSSNAQLLTMTIDDVEHLLLEVEGALHGE